MARYATIYEPGVDGYSPYRRGKRARPARNWETGEQTWEFEMRFSDKYVARHKTDLWGTPLMLRLFNVRDDETRNIW